MQFLQFCANLNQKPKSVKATYMYGSESSYDSLSQNDMVYRVWATVYEILVIKISKKILTQQKFNKILRFQTLIFSKH